MARFIRKANINQPRMQQETINSASSMYYEKAGTGRAVVLLHGFPESGRLWNNLKPKLSAAYTLIIPDLPGSGKSPLQRETDIPAMADEVKKILDKENIDRAILAGHSMG